MIYFSISKYRSVLGINIFLLDIEGAVHVKQIVYYEQKTQNRFLPPHPLWRAAIGSLFIFADGIAVMNPKGAIGEGTGFCSSSLQF